jgi:hypothetical protein
LSNSWASPRVFRGRYEALMLDLIYLAAGVAVLALFGAYAIFLRRI